MTAFFFNLKIDLEKRLLKIPVDVVSNKKEPVYKH